MTRQWSIGAPNLSGPTQIKVLYELHANALGLWGRTGDRRLKLPTAGCPQDCAGHFSGPFLLCQSYHGLDFGSWMHPDLSLFSTGTRTRSLYETGGRPHPDTWDMEALSVGTGHILDVRDRTIRFIRYAS